MGLKTPLAKYDIAALIHNEEMFRLATFRDARGERPEHRRDGRLLRVWRKQATNSVLNSPRGMA